MGRKHVSLSPLREFVELLLANIVIRNGNMRNMGKFDWPVTAVIKIWLHFSLDLYSLRLCEVQLRQDHGKNHDNGSLIKPGIDMKSSALEATSWNSQAQKLINKYYTITLFPIQVFEQREFILKVEGTEENRERFWKKATLIPLMVNGLW